MGVLDNVLSGGATSAMGAGMGMITGAFERDKAIEHNRALINQQTKASKDLTIFNRQQQMQMWKDTNYKAQRKELTKAGLNTGLMYGMSGGGGATAQVATGGTPSGGAGSGRKDVQEGAALGLQTAMTGAQLENLKANSRKTNADAESQELDNTTKTRFGQEADIYEASNRRDKALVEGQYKYEGIKGNQDDPRKTEFDKLEAEYQNILNNSTITKIEKQIKEETQEDVKNKIAYDTASAEMDKYVKEQGIKLSQEQERKIWHDIWQGWTREGFNGLGKIIDGAFKNGLLKKK